ncbi:MFS transporter [Halalkalibacterium halodurans]|uniref:BH1161 protein n=1 Tax=Halalkalibacterium halodurans (strain ATCC BAA-125 / DSM 18197 / FERM 7344 / JCM 9153 / C-125) TaxID=272558 RepID=Q9KDQ0_HALH5|nr:MFS transporter [Halalkalibacterium halodurans]MED4108120.1 MFS transporter [Halalkalibacterium halodurans]MED4171603.1 MFS transporter [Halalkalibacterium halodurans]BAB04880.1 BH1161 [Halalkalibacterium halodurans C-125]
MSGRQRVRWIAILTAIALLGDSMILIVLPLYWEEFGLTAIWQVGVLLSVNRLIRLPINPLVGWFYRTYERRTGFFIAMSLALVTTLAYGYVQGFIWLLIARILWGVAWAFIRLGGYLTVLDHSNSRNRGELIGLYNGLWGLGGLVGMLAGGIVVEQTSIAFVTTLFAGAACFSLPTLFKVIPRSVSEQVRDKTDGKGDWFSIHTGSILLLSFTTGLVIFGVFATTLSPFVERMIDDNWTWHGLVIGAATVAGLIQAVRWAWDPFVAPMVGKRLDRMRTKGPVVFSMLLMIASLFFIAGSVHDFVLASVFLLVFQLISTIFVTLTDSLAAEVANQTDRVRMMTAHTIAIDLGAALGPLIGFLVVATVHLSFLYFMTSSWLLLLAIYWCWYEVRKKESEYSPVKNIDA